MKTMCLIPARAGSKGIPGKNMVEVGGKPLIWYTIEAAFKVFNSRDIYVSTDIERIADSKCLYQPKSSKCCLIIKRPTELAQDDTPIIPVIQHALKEVDKDYDVVCLLQPTSPVRPDGLIQRCIQALETNETADSSFTVARIPHQYHPRSALFLTRGLKKVWAWWDHEEPAYEPRQELTPVYYRTGQVYVTRTNTINEGTLYGKNQFPIIRTAPEELINIDTPEDLERFREYRLTLARKVSE